MRGERDNVAVLRAKDLNIGHAVINVLVSADVVTGRANPLSKLLTVIYGGSAGY
jgi:hypothetical protein